MPIADGESILLVVGGWNMEGSKDVGPIDVSGIEENNQE